MVIGKFLNDTGKQKQNLDISLGRTIRAQRILRFSFMCCLIVCVCVCLCATGWCWISSALCLNVAPTCWLFVTLWPGNWPDLRPCSGDNSKQTPMGKNCSFLFVGCFFCFFVFCFSSFSVRYLPYLTSRQGYHATSGFLDLWVMRPGFKKYKLTRHFLLVIPWYYWVGVFFLSSKMS